MYFDSEKNKLNQELNKEKIKLKQKEKTTSNAMQTAHTAHTSNKMKLKST